VALLKSRHADFCWASLAIRRNTGSTVARGRSSLICTAKSTPVPRSSRRSLFFDNRPLLPLVERCRAAGITVHRARHHAVLSLNTNSAFHAMCGASLPKALVSALKGRGEYPTSSKRLGIDWA